MSDPVQQALSDAARRPVALATGRPSPRVGMLDAVGRRLLDSVIDITAEHEHARFRASFRNTLQELLEVGEVTFVRPLDTGEGELAFHELRVDPLAVWSGVAPPPRCDIGRAQVEDMLLHGQATLVAPGRVTLLLPVVYREVLVEIVTVAAPELPTEAYYLLRAFSRLYRNFLGLIMETERDALTGLFNRRTLETRLAQLSEEMAGRHAAAARRNDRRGGGDALSHYVAMIDIDRFKRINDSYGHLFGDEVLLLVSRLMREVLRDEDMLFRYGGEEFCAVLACHTRGAARGALERLREAVAAHPFPQLGQVTLSAGMAEMRGRELPAEAIARADRALYRAKDGGRNQVRDYDTEEAAGHLAARTVADDVELF